MPKGDREISAEQINGVLLKVRELSPFEGDARLSLLAIALVVASRSCKVDKNTLLKRVRQAANLKIDMAPLPPLSRPH